MVIDAEIDAEIIMQKNIEDILYWHCIFMSHDLIKNLDEGKVRFLINQFDRIWFRNLQTRMNQKL